MAYTILTESYGRRLPKITATADSTDDLTALGVEFAEGSTVDVGGTVYSLDKVSGWIIPDGEGGTSVYDENDLIIRLDYYWDDINEKCTLLSITPSLADIGERITSDTPIGLKRLIATEWNSAEKEFIRNRVICDTVRIDMAASGGNMTYSISGSYSETIFPEDSYGSFEHFQIQYNETDDEVTVTNTIYAVSITEDN